MVQINIENGRVWNNISCSDVFTYADVVVTGKKLSFSKTIPSVYFEAQKLYSKYQFQQHLMRIFFAQRSQNCNKDSQVESVFLRFWNVDKKLLITRW